MKLNHIRLSFFLLLAFSMLVTETQAQLKVKQLKKHIQYLSKDQLLGRETGTPGAEHSANYIEKHFKKYGLVPKGTKGFRQAFTAKITRVQNANPERQAENIIGFLDNGAPYTIVIGAHYDHLGQGHIGGSKDSLGLGKIHNGADDNASGVAGLLELARHYSSNKIKEAYNILFIGFCAEELGLLGSKYFTENPTIALPTIHWMLNMDMIGRYQAENGLAIIGYGTSSAFPKIMKDIRSDIKFFTSKDGNGGSDQTSFYRKNIPVLFFHTGGHPDYHMPTDDEDKIDYKAMMSILKIEMEVLDNSMKQPKMDFQWTN